MKKENKRWYTINGAGKKETIFKNYSMWEHKGYSLKETETEILLIKKD